MFALKITRGWLAAACVLWLTNGLSGHPVHAQSPHPGLLGGFGQGAGAGSMPPVNGLGFTPLFIPLTGGPISGGTMSGAGGAMTGAPMPGGPMAGGPMAGGPMAGAMGAGQMTPAEMAAMQMMMMAGMAGGYGGVKTGLNPGYMNPAMGMMQGGFGDAGDDQQPPAPKRRRHRAAREPKAKARPVKAPAAARKKPRR